MTKIHSKFNIFVLTRAIGTGFLNSSTYTKALNRKRQTIGQLGFIYHFYFSNLKSIVIIDRSYVETAVQTTNLIKKLMKAKQETTAGKRPELVKTYLRNTIIFPEMIGGVVGVHNGKTFKMIGIRPEMVGHYLGEFASTHKRRPHAANQSSKSPKSSRK